MRRLARGAAILGVLLAAQTALPAGAQVLSPELEFRLVPNVGYGWTSVTLQNTFTAAVPVCTYVLPSAASPPATVRIRNITASSFQVRIQQFEDSAAITPGDVHCAIAEEGAHTLADGRRFEALRVLSTQTSGNTVGWQTSRTEDITGLIQQGYANPILLGQVISHNDNRASVFFATDCEGRQNEPFLSGLSDGACVGKHVGMINSSRASETLGVIIAESGSGTVNGLAYSIGMTGNIFQGVGNSPPYAHAVSGDFDVGAATKGGENGGHGGWFVFYGSDPLPPGRLEGAIDEEVVTGDTSRTHVNEIVFYWLIDDQSAPALSLTKTAAAPTYSFAGESISYSYLIANIGNVAVDAISLIDDRIGAISCPVSSLAPGGSMTCTASDTISVGDVAAGSVTNTATADGIPAGGALTPATDTETITLATGAAVLAVTKTVDVVAPRGYALPGEDFVYTLTVTNTGSGAPDAGSLFLVDALPGDVEFRNSDIDGPGPETGPVSFTESGSTVTLNPVTDIAYSDALAKPSGFAACNYTPTPGYDGNVRHVCFRPGGTLTPGNPPPEFSLSFRARLR